MGHAQITPRVILAYPSRPCQCAPCPKIIFTTPLGKPQRHPKHNDRAAMPRPFPFPVNIGTDICSVHRIFNILKAQNGSGADAFLRRIFTDQEREQFQHRSYSKTLQSWHKLQNKKIQLDKRREDLGIPKTWREQLALMARDDEKTADVNSTTNAPKLYGDAGFDTTANAQTPLESLALKVNNVEILRRLEDEIKHEQSTMLPQLQKVAQFLAGRQVQPPGLYF